MEDAIRALGCANVRLSGLLAEPCTAQSSGHMHGRIRTRLKDHMTLLRNFEPIASCSCVTHPRAERRALQKSNRLHPAKKFAYVLFNAREREHNSDQPRTFPIGALMRGLRSTWLYRRCRRDHTRCFALRLPGVQNPPRSNENQVDAGSSVGLFAWASRAAKVVTRSSGGCCGRTA